MGLHGSLGSVLQWQETMQQARNPTKPPVLVSCAHHKASDHPDLLSSNLNCNPPLFNPPNAHARQITITSQVTPQVSGRAGFSKQ